MMWLVDDLMELSAVDRSDVCRLARGPVNRIIPCAFDRNELNQRRFRLRGDLIDRESRPCRRQQPDDDFIPELFGIVDDAKIDPQPSNAAGCGRPAVRRSEMSIPDMILKTRDVVVLKMVGNGQHVVQHAVTRCLTCSSPGALDVYVAGARFRASLRMR